jgi:uncharacterized membrane protein YesL
VGLFSANYNKPGPGIEKDEPQKPRFFIFFDVLKRKFWHLIRINMLYVLCNLPALVLAFVISSVFMQKIKLDGGFGDFFIRFFIAALMIFIPVIAIGPVQAGFTYIMRNYSREEHAFIWWDFKENFVKNFKQGMIITGVDLVVMYILAIALNFYSTAQGLLSIAATSFVILSIIIFFIMHLYIYPMLVTVHLSIKNLYKNAFIFSILKLFPNILFFALNILIAFGTFYNLFLGIILYIFIMPSIVGLMNNFYVNPVIKKYVIDPMQPQVTEQDGDNDEETESDEDEGEKESFYKTDYIEEDDKE